MVRVTGPRGWASPIVRSATWICGRQVEGRVRRDGAVLQRAGHRERLEGRARLVGVADRAVLRGVAGRGARVVGVDARPVGQRQHLAGVGVHDDRGRALGPVGRADVGEHALDLVLDRGVDRQLQARPRLGGLRVADRDRLAERVVDQAPLAVGALQQLVVGVLEAAQAVAVGADRAQQLAGQVLAGVDAPVRRGELDAGELQLLHRRALAGGHRAREVDEAAVALRELAQERVGVDPEQRRELGGRLGRVLDQVRRRRDVVGGLGDRELDAVAVDDRAAPRRQLQRADLLAGGRAGQARALDGAEEEGAPGR